MAHMQGLTYDGQPHIAKPVPHAKHGQQHEILAQASCSSRLDLWIAASTPSFTFCKPTPSRMKVSTNCLSLGLRVSAFSESTFKPLAYSKSPQMMGLLA